jgi:GT2 family glycosyltransferase
MNANCVLVPWAVVQRIGIFHHGYTHAMGDFDYGFTARRAGIQMIASGRILGTSRPNPEVRTWRDTSLPRTERLRLLWSDQKGLPFLEWATYARRNLGWTWPYRVLSPAMRVLAGR